MVKSSTPRACPVWLVCRPSGTSGSQQVLTPTLPTDLAHTVGDLTQDAVLTGLAT